ncbi:T9SS type A sorting domain-containing protein [Pseudopedobacter sp.]|uniref:T9SS type A sorting domain-containing protein n=1 Tax=Pseudopedobacter sp. TaxID=1936787 RepID=UPI0033402F12
MKNLSLFLGLCLVTFSSKAQVINGNMSGTNLNYVNQSTTVNTPGAGNGWGVFFGGTEANQNLDIVSTTDTDAGSGQGTVIKLTATGQNTDIANNARLVQRLSTLTSNNSVYRLTFKAKATTANTTILAPSLRVSYNSLPAVVLNGYDGIGLPAHIPITLTQSWAEYYVDYDLSRHVAGSMTSSGTFSTGQTAPTPAICFSLQCSATEATAGIGVMIDDVSFTSLSTTPIELISFNGKVDKSGNLALLEWKTASNSMMKFIEIEKSIDGILFSKIASVDPRDDKTYTYTDENFRAQNAYYRLNQTDIDGTSSYSPVIYLKHDNADNLSIFPNPASDKIIVSHPNSTAYSTLKIIASTGQNVYQSKINALNSQTTIDIQNLSSGIYLVVLESGKDKQYLKFIK